MKMTETEMRELDAWIAENVFGITGQNGIKISDSQAAIDRINNDTSFPDCISEDMAIGAAMPQFPRYTTDPAAAMEVLKKGAEKLDSFSKRFHITIDSHGGHWYCNCHPYLFDDEGQETLEIAIALFARKLFSK